MNRFDPSMTHNTRLLAIDRHRSPDRGGVVVRKALSTVGARGGCGIAKVRCAGSTSGIRW